MVKLREILLAGTLAYGLNACDVGREEFNDAGYRLGLGRTTYVADTLLYGVDPKVTATLGIAGLLVASKLRKRREEEE